MRCTGLRNPSLGVASTASESETGDLASQFQRLNHELNLVRAERDAMINSRAWRMTLPVRGFIAWIRKL
jgi:hypothetical protein